MIPTIDRPATASRLAALAVTLLLLAGCADEPIRAPDAGATRHRTPSTGAVALEQPETRTYRGPWEDPTNPLYRRTIYFDYDSAEIKPEYIAVMRTHAAYLGTNSARRVTLEGHTDERGTREYNLALGDQRAEAVKRFMIAEGVLPDQLDTLSYGEERPVGSAHDDASWRQNRRVYIHY